MKHTKQLRMRSRLEPNQTPETIVSHTVPIKISTKSETHMTTTRRLKVEPLPGATFGAVITGIDLTHLSRAMWADIEAALHQ